MSLPTDVAHEVAERAPQPGFDAVVDRAHGARRRRRTTIASGLAAVVVVAGVGFAVDRPGVGGEQRPEPARPAPSTPWDGTSEVDSRLPSDVGAVLDDDQLQLWSIAGGPGDGTAAVWRGCDFDPCRFAVVTHDADDVFGQALGASFPQLTPVPGGWLVADARGIFTLSASGERAEIVDTGPGSADVMPGDTFVETGDGPRLLRGTKLIPVPAPPDSQATAGYVTPGGELVVASDGPGGRSRLSVIGPDGSGWESSLLSRTTEPIGGMALSGSGDTVALATLGDDPDGSIPVLSVQVSSDAGRTWTLARGVTDMRNLSSMVVAPSGTTYLTTESHGLLRVDADGNASATRLSSLDMAALAVGPDICVVAEAGRIDVLQCSADDGKTWAPQSLPGFG